MPNDNIASRLFSRHGKKPSMALLGTVNWMRALAILLGCKAFRDDTEQIVASNSWKREVEQSLLDQTAEKLLLAENYVSALNALRGADNPADVMRLGVLSWYYAIYFASQAMLLIARQGAPERHAKIIRCWLQQLCVQRRTPLVPSPLSIHVSSLVRVTVDEEVENRTCGTGRRLTEKPTSRDEAIDLHLAYLRGTADYYREQEEQKIRKTDNDFKALGVSDFKRKAARDIRDKALAKRSVGFLDMVYRYRGKANYRDAMYMSYGRDGHGFEQFLADLAIVSRRYCCMARIWVRARTHREKWRLLQRDLTKNSRLSGGAVVPWEDDWDEDIC